MPLLKESVTELGLTKAEDFKSILNWGIIEDRSYIFSNGGEFENLISNYVNNFSRRGQTEGIYALAYEEMQKKNPLEWRIFWFGRSWVISFADEHLKKKYDARDEAATKTCLDIFLSAGEYLGVRDERINQIKSSLHRTLIQSMTGCVLYGMWLESEHILNNYLSNLPSDIRDIICRVNEAMIEAVEKRGFPSSESCKVYKSGFPLV